MLPFANDTGKAAPTPGDLQRDSGQYVTFTCSTQHYGIDILSVREIRTWSPVTAVPNQGPHAMGVMDVRGSILSVFELSQLLGLPSSVRGHDQQVIVVASLRDRDVGLLVDTVSDIVFASPEQFRPAPRMVGSDAPGSLKAILKHEDALIGVLDLNQLFPDMLASAAA